MNSSPIRLRFSSGSIDAVEPREEPLLRLDVHERHVEVAAERLDHLLRLALAQQPVVDEHARELIADRPVHEQRRDRASRRRPRARTARARDPTCARMRSTCSSITAAGVQTGGAPATS